MVLMALTDQLARQENIFLPLGMGHTYWSVAATNRVKAHSGFVAGFSKNSSNLVPAAYL